MDSFLENVNTTRHPLPSVGTSAITRPMEQGSSMTIFFREHRGPWPFTIINDHPTHLETKNLSISWNFLDPNPQHPLVYTKIPMKQGQGSVSSPKHPTKIFELMNQVYDKS